MLAVVRDAAARLPDNVGTRSDVVTLLKDSQYIRKDVSDPAFTSAVSGSLDRLSAEKDPCVRYDCHYKLWVYLHSGRPIESPKWDLNIDDEFKRAYERTNERYLIKKEIEDSQPDYHMGGGHKLQYPSSRDYLIPKMNNGTPNYMGVSPNAGSTYESSMMFQGSSHN